MAKKKGKSKFTKNKHTVKPSDVIIAVVGAVNQPLRVCRLCENKDGPFLNIFDAEKATAKKLEYLMPFGIAENDDLPHKICFRCSAKVEELHEFIQKCIKTQQNLRVALGKTDPIVSKTKTHRSLWEEKLNKSNISNDDICDAVIKKAMEGIKDIPLNTLNTEEKQPIKASLTPIKPGIETSKCIEETVPVESSKKITIGPKDVAHHDSIKENETNANLLNKQASSTIGKHDQKAISTRSSRSNNVLRNELEVPGNRENVIKSKGKKSANASQNSNLKPKENPETVNRLNVSEEISDKNNKNVKDLEKIEHKTEIEKPFNIMDHVSMIKVNGVGVLFQCKLCNRNFLKKGVVKSHICAKSGKKISPVVDLTKKITPPEPPKVSSVKYINTKVDIETKKLLMPKDNDNSSGETTLKKPGAVEDKLNIDIKIPESKPKPKIGPASKVKRDANDLNMASLLSLPHPTVPSLNCPYKLVPGPNNTFTLVEEPHNQDNINEQSSKLRVSKKRVAEDIQEVIGTKSKERKLESSSHDNSLLKTSIPEVIDLEAETSDSEVSVSQPYPVGLFQTVPKYSNVHSQPVSAQPDAFATSAIKKQSYTIVQTGNPSKLLISTKPLPCTAETTKKRVKKVNPKLTETEKTEPFSVTLEDATRPKDSDFFTFINVDPLLQPSYVLPTDSVQESQISTSVPAGRNNEEGTISEKERYTCNMCGEKFTREKKLLAHIHSHYNKMDEEDQLRAEKCIRKRGKKALAK